jgi:hypothetical protein
MGGINQSPSPFNQGYKPVSVFEKDGQYYKREFRSPSQKGQVSPRPGQFGGSPTPGGPFNKGAVSPMSFQPINFGGAGSPGVSSSSRYSRPSLYTPRRSRASKVPSYDPNNPQEDAIKDPKLREAASDLNEQAPPGERLAFINPTEEKLLKAVGGSGMTAAGGVPSYKKGDVEAPPPRDYGQETADTLQAQVDLAPQLFASEAQFRPEYANLERGIMLENLGLDPNMNLLDAFSQVNLAQKDIQRDATAADIDMIRELGPELAEAQRQADPEADALRQAIMADASAGLEEGAGEFSQLTQDAREDYLSGEGLTDLEKRELDQQILEGAAERGMSMQASTLQDQIASRLSANREIRDQRRNIFERALANENAAQQQALQNAGVAYSMGNFDPLLALTGRSGTAPMMAQQGFGSSGFALDSSPAIFNPESAYAGSLAASNQQNIMDARTATAANRANMFGGLLGGAGRVFGGMATGGTGFFS